MRPTAALCALRFYVGTSVDAHVANEQFPPAKMSLIPASAVSGINKMNYGSIITSGTPFLASKALF